MSERFEILPQRICLDTNILIYLFERDTGQTTALRRFLDRLMAGGGITMISEIGVAECLYGANKRADTVMARQYAEIFFRQSLIDVVPLTSEILLQAARIGPEAGLKLIDSLHFCSALAARCDAFITNDARFQTGYGLRVLQFSTLSES
jgi:predicted nucleic acid-binding protein